MYFVTNKSTMLIYGTIFIVVSKAQTNVSTLDINNFIIATLET